MIRFNRKHFLKAKETPVYMDKIRKALQYNKIRDKVVEGKLTRNEVQNDDVYEFLKLLTPNNRNKIQTSKFDLVTLDEWRSIVKRSKKKSVSSVFSKRTYVIYKLINSNDDFLEVLIQFYNLAL